MSDQDVAQTYERLAARFSATVEDVPDERWETPSACSEWSNRDVVKHVVQLHTMLLQGADVELPEGPTVDDDPAAAWDRVRSATQVALTDTRAAEREFDSGFAGVTSLVKIFGSFGGTDLVIHRWDLAHGAEVDDTIPEEDLDLVWSFVHDKDDMLRGGDAFDDAIEVGAEASQQERVLAFLGRPS